MHFVLSDFGDLGGRLYGTRSVFNLQLHNFQRQRSLENPGAAPQEIVRQNMGRKSSAQEKRLIERELIARQAAAAKRRSRYRAVFVVGLLAAIGNAALRAFQVPTLVTPFLACIWLVCVAVYLGLAVFPNTFSKGTDPRWQLNPWQEALCNLSQGKTRVEAIALLVSPFLARSVFTFIHLGLKS